jgi:hypothetical protein
VAHSARDGAAVRPSTVRTREADGVGFLRRSHCAERGASDPHPPDRRLREHSPSVSFTIYKGGLCGSVQAKQRYEAHGERQTVLVASRHACRLSLASRNDAGRSGLDSCFVVDVPERLISYRTYAAGLLGEALAEPGAPQDPRWPSASLLQAPLEG